MENGNLLSNDDFASSADVLASLGGTFVGASLETDDGLSGLQLLFSEFTFVLVGGFGSKVWSFPFAVLVGLSAQSEQGVGYLGDVLGFPQVYSLEDINIGNSVSLDGGLEAVEKRIINFWRYAKIQEDLLVDVFHHFELSTGCVDLWYGSGGEFVDQLAENGSVLKNFFVKLAWGEFGSKNGFDPFLSFFVLFWVTLGSDLDQITVSLDKIMVYLIVTYFSGDLTLQWHVYCLDSLVLAWTLICRVKKVSVATLIYENMCVLFPIALPLARYVILQRNLVNFSKLFTFFGRSFRFFEITRTKCSRNFGWNESGFWIAVSCAVGICQGIMGTVYCICLSFTHSN